MKRRDFLKSSTSAGAGLALTNLVPSRLLAQSASGSGSVIVLFIRGAWDALNVLPALNGVDRTAYEAARPNLKIATDKILPLGTGYSFGLHPSWTNLKSLWDSGNVAIIPRAGSLNPSRSHFEQQDLIEAGSSITSMYYGNSGYLGRAFKLAGGQTSEKYWAVSMGLLQAPSTFIGATGLAQPYVINNLAQFGKIDQSRVISSKNVVDKLKYYRLHPDDVNCTPFDKMSVTEYKICRAGKDAQGTVSELSGYTGDNGVTLANNLQQACTLIKEKGVRFATVDMNGWDTHFNQVAADDSSTGTQANLIKSLDAAINEYVLRAKQLGIYNKTTLVVMSEFGRTVLQNGNRGTDHGRGGLALVIGGNVKGKLTASQMSDSTFRFRKGWNFKASEVVNGTSNAVDVDLQGDLRHVMARVLSKSLGKSYNDLKGEFAGAAMPTADSLRIFG